MAPNISKRDAERIDEALHDNPNIDMNELACLFQTSYNTIQKRRASLRLRMGPDYKLNKCGRPSIITDEIRDYVQSIIERNPTVYLDEIADFVFMEFGIQIDNPRVSRLLKALRTSHKKLSVQAAQRDETLISA